MEGGAGGRKVLQASGLWNAIYGTKLPTPRKSDMQHGPEMTKVRGEKLTGMNLPTVFHPAAQSGQTSDKWAYARQLAAMLTEAKLVGPSMTLPITYGWMMGFPPGWLARALRSAVARGSLLPASSSKRSATLLSRKSQKP